MVQTPQPPYYAVIFTSLRTDNSEGYNEIGDKLDEIAKEYKGFLGMDSVRNGLGISISYWKNMESIKAWKANADHIIAMQFGKEKWYKQYNVRIALVEREYGFEK